MASFHPEELPAIFVTYAADVLGVISGPQIVKLTAAYAIDFNVSIPHATYPFTARMGINKRTALAENMLPFNSVPALSDHP